MACKKCHKVFRKDTSYRTGSNSNVCRAAMDESDEYCPHCDNHYVIAAVEPKPILAFEGDDARLVRDSRMKPCSATDVGFA